LHNDEPVKESKEDIDDTSSSTDVHEQHEVNVPKEKFLEHDQHPKTPIEVLSSNPILISVAKKHLKVF
jgi:hypothetical protein